jgi:4-hydroxybenzoate polyprenyltransferase/cellulose synthase/poly-beta-1,6-N-acetylglucosamine synthase-like glycosyltransferase
MKTNEKNNSLTIREVLATSRPVSWINTAAPFAVGYLLAARTLNIEFFVGTLYFLFAYNLLLYGVNDIYDYESDIKNPRKNSVQGGLIDKRKHQALWLVIAAVNIPFLGYLLYSGSNTARIMLVLTVIFCFTYSAKPLRFKEIPFVDSINSALHFVSPLIFGLLYGGATTLYWPAIVAFMLWGMASQALGAIQDIRPDRAAGIASIATVLGARRTSRYSLWLYVATCVIVAIAYFPYGIIAAALLALYILNVSFFYKFRSDAHSAQFRRAWQNFMWLNLLVGFFLAQILLFVFDPFNVSSQYVTIFGGFLLVLFSLQLLLTLYNLVQFRRPKTKRHSELPMVSILAYTYNQADNISSTLLAALGQEYPNFEVVLTDLGSTDNTPKIISGYQDPRLRLINIPPRKPGWTIHAWAAEQLLQQATGEVVVLISADTVLLPNALSILVGLINEQKKSLVSVLPADQNKSLGQQLILSQNHFFMLGAYPSAILARTHPKVANASSSLVAFLRSSIDAMGGFALVQKSPLEDFDLAAAAKAKGLDTGFYLGSDVATSQNHASTRLIITGNLRRFYPALHFSMPLCVSLIIGGLIVFALPTLMLISLLALGMYEGVFILVAAIGLSYINRLIITISSRQSIVSTLLFPLGTSIELIILFGSMIEYELLKPRWQNRTEAF